MYVKIFVFLEEGCSVQVTPSFESKKMKNTFVKQATQLRDNPILPPYLSSPPPLQHTEMP
jgi:hypothetical protein